MAVQCWDVRAQTEVVYEGCGSKRGALHCLTRLARCDGVVVILDGHEGKGTAAERAVAKWLGLPWYELTVNQKWPADHRDGVYVYALGQLGARWRQP
jgi:nucleoside 2-deoxyribosyltransferase